MDHSARTEKESSSNYRLSLAAIVSKDFVYNLVSNRVSCLTSEMSSWKGDNSEILSRIR